MQGVVEVRCQRIGCDATFSEDNNPEGSCQYHDSVIALFFFSLILFRTLSLSLFILNYVYFYFSILLTLAFFLFQFGHYCAGVFLFQGVSISHFILFWENILCFLFLYN